MGTCDSGWPHVKVRCSAGGRTITSTSQMAVQSTLRGATQSLPSFADISKKYSTHRSVIQPILKALFVAYCLGNTYSNFVKPKGSEDSRSGRRKGKGKAGNEAGVKKERVKVSRACAVVDDVLKIDLPYRLMPCFMLG
jgi:hypothetical protein